MKYRQIIEKKIYADFLKAGKTLDVGGANVFDDLADEMFTCNIKEMKGNFKKVDLEKGKLPYKDNFFDNVIITHVVEHLDSFKAILKECKRVLKKDGTLIVTIPNPNTLRDKIHFFLTDEIRVVRLPISKGGHRSVVLPYLLKDFLTTELGFKKIHESYNACILPVIRVKFLYGKLFAKNYTLILKN